MYGGECAEMLSQCSAMFVLKYGIGQMVKGAWVCGFVAARGAPFCYCSPDSSMRLGL